MALPNNTSILDSVTNTMVPYTLSTWGNLTSSTWESWTNWNFLSANVMTVMTPVVDRGTTNWFNLEITADVTGNIAYGVFVSNTGAFDGEETRTEITPNTSNLAAFYGRFYAVAANVSGLNQLALRSITVTDSNRRFDIQFNDIDTQNLSAGTQSGTRILPLPRTIGAVTNMQVTAHNATSGTTTYLSTGNGPTGYIVNYNGPSTTISNLVTTSGATVEYLAMGIDNYANVTAGFRGVRVFKTQDGISWDSLANIPNVAALCSTVAWNSAGDRLAAGFRSSANLEYEGLRTYTRSGDTFTKRNDPDTWPVGWVRQVAYSPNDSYLAVAHDESPYITIYSISGNNLQKLSDPATLPTGVAYGLAWDPTSTYLAVAHGSSPYLTIYKRSGNTFTKLANPTILPATGVAAGTSIDFDPSGTYVAWGGGGTAGRVRLYFRSGDTFAMVTTANIDFTDRSTVGVKYNPTGTHIAIGFLDSQDWYIYNQTGNTVANSNISVTSGIGTTWKALGWSDGGSKFYRGNYNGNITLHRGMDIYDVAYSGTGNANITLTGLTGITSNVGNVSAIAALTTAFSPDILVANAAIFSIAGGNARINNESISYETANVTPTPNRLEGVIRGITTTAFGTSTANIHAVGSEIFPIEQLDLTARYFVEETVGITHAYIAEKDRTAPTIIIRDAAGTTADTTVDAVIWALPEQYMETTDLKIR
jgi:hypothetical protein